MDRKTRGLDLVDERILVVDDEQEMLGLLQLQLLKLGLEADLAPSGQAAVEQLAQHDYGLVLTDIDMPGMDGMELLEHMQKYHADTDVLVMSGYSKLYSFTDIIAAGAQDFISKPFSVDVLKAKLERIFRERLLVADLAESREREKSFFLHIVESLAITLEEKDPYTHGHSRRVTNLALQLAEQVKEQVVDVDLLRLCSILHDIGKIGVPDSLLASPDNLSLQEFEIVRKHPAQGAHILQPMKSDKRVAKISKVIMHHHEKYDGTGYPAGLAGEKIPLLSRIIAIADSYDAMTSDRPYRKGLDVGAAIADIRKNSGIQFDPVLVEKFISLIQECQGGIPCSCLPQCPNALKGVAHNVADRQKRYCHANFRACEWYKSGSAANELFTFLSSIDGLLEEQDSPGGCEAGLN